jgi:hypothetical protein
LRNLGLAGVWLVIGGYGVLTSWVAPLTVRVAYDPSMQYMLTSLAWYRGTPYTYIDHPGTPVEILGTILLLLSHPFIRHASELISFHLSQPQYFLSVAQTVVVGASLVVSVLLARQAVAVTHWSLALATVAISGLYFGIHPLAFGSLAKWSHESFIFPAGTGASLGLLALVRRPGLPSWRWVLALGFGTGVLTSIQLYFAAWVLGAAVALSIAARLHGGSVWRALLHGAAVIGMAVLGFIVSTLPIHDRYGDLVAWVWALTTHQGTYGTGPQGVATPDVLVTNALVEFGQAPTLIGAVVGTAAVLVWRLIVVDGTSHRTIAVWSAGLGLTCQSLLIVLLAAKHPGVKYLLPLAATLPVLLAVALGQLRPTRSTAAVAAAVGVLGMAALVGSFWAAVSAHLSLAEVVTRGDEETARMLVQAAANRSTPTPSAHVLWTYGTTSACYALWFGDETAGQPFNRDIGRLCPRDLALNVWTARVVASDVNTPVADFPGWDLAVIPAGITRERPAALPRGALIASSVPSLGYDNLIFVLNTDTGAGTPPRGASAGFGV